MNNSNLKIKLIEKIINGDDTFLMRLEKFIIADENRLKFEIKKRELYDEINEDDWNLIPTTSDLKESEINNIIKNLIIGILDDKGFSTKQIIDKTKEFNHLAIKGRGAETEISRCRAIYKFIKKNPFTKMLFLKGLISPNMLTTNIIHKNIKDVDNYLKGILIEKEYFNENGNFSVPRYPKSKYIKRIEPSDLK